MARKKATPTSDTGGDQGSTSPSEPPDRPLRIDEYIDDAYDVRELDALDVPAALRDERVLADVAEARDGIEEVDLLDLQGEETVDTGMRRKTRDDAEMGLGSEPHSADELEEAAIGNALPGRRGITRDDELHGHGLMDPQGDEEDELR